MRGYLNIDWDLCHIPHVSPDHRQEPQTGDIPRC